MNEQRASKQQAGYALLIILIVLMGIGGVVAANFTQEVKERAEFERHLHNKRVLAEAKQALLQYTYNYPVNNPSRGPGRLPCPDTDNDGLPDPSFNCINGGEMVGRLPWADSELNLPDLRDASGERLWYAVSQNFANTISPSANDVINSSTVGTITVEDQTGQVLFDGATGGGVAAVIIAPGPAIDRNGVFQNRSADENDPVNYLDTIVWPGEDAPPPSDNAEFINGNSNGFILGPVDDLATGIQLVNDQFILITAEEVIEVAEKATLQAYRTAILNYLSNTGNQYPWLYNYTDVPDVPGLMTFYPGDNVFANEQAIYLGNRGRIPSMFNEYFRDENSGSIQSKLDIAWSVTLDGAPAQINRDGGGPFEFNSSETLSLNVQTREIMTDVRFEDGANTEGRLSGNALTPDVITQELWFWDELGGGATGPYSLCPDDGNGVSELCDCWREADGTPDPCDGNDGDERILRVFLEIDLDGVFTFDTDYAAAPRINVVTPADGNSHARISAVFAGVDVVLGTLPIKLRYELDENYLAGENFQVQQSGTFDLNDPDVTIGDLTLGLRYYPVLPRWVFSNGWHDSILMAYAAEYLPGGFGGPCLAPGTCLLINNQAGITHDNISLLVLAGEHDWEDDDLPGYSDDLDKVFAIQNDNTNDTFDARAPVAIGTNDGADKLLVIEEL